MMERKIIKGMMLVLIGFTACYYDSEEELYPSTGCQTANMSLQTTIVPILQRNCYVCHSAAANTSNITLEGYTQLIKYVNSGQLIGAIRHESGFTSMPQNASKLLSCDIAKIEQWVADGAPDN
jgi:hypothetical protein